MLKYFLVKIKLLKKKLFKLFEKQNMWVNWFMFFSSSCFLVIFYTLSNSVSLVILVLLHSSILILCCVWYVVFSCFVRLCVCPSVCLYTCCCQWVNVSCEYFVVLNLTPPLALSLSHCIFKQCYCKGLNVRDVVRLKSSVELLGPQKLFKRFRNGKCVASS